MTLSKVIIDFQLGLKDFCRGLSFVAISRARSLNDIVFLNEIGQEQLKNLGGLDKVKEDMQRRENLRFQDVNDVRLVRYYFND